MRKKSDALSKAWETINTPLIAADSAMKDKAEEEKKERKSLLLAIKRNSREREARHITKRMPIKSAQSKENNMSRIRGQSETHTTGSIAREKQATHAHISKLMDDLPKDKPSKGITVTKKTVSMKPVSKTKPVTLCDLKKKAGINLFFKYREKEAAEKRAALWDKLLRAGKLSNVSKNRLVDLVPHLKKMTNQLSSSLNERTGVGVEQVAKIDAKDLWQPLRKLFASPAKPVGTPMSKLKAQAKGTRSLRERTEAVARKAKGRTAPSSSKPKGELAKMEDIPTQWWREPVETSRQRFERMSGRPRTTSSGNLPKLGRRGGGLKPIKYNRAAPFTGADFSDAADISNVKFVPSLMDKLKNLFKRGSDSQQADAKRFMLKIAASNLSPREKLAAAGLIGRGLAAGAKALPGLMRGAGKAVRGAGSLAGKGLEGAGKGVQSAGKGVRSLAPRVQIDNLFPPNFPIPVGAVQQSAKSIGDAGLGAGKAMQAGGRAMQAAPGVAGGAGLAGAGGLGYLAGRAAGNSSPSPATPGFDLMPQDAFDTDSFKRIFTEE